MKMADDTMKKRPSFGSSKEGGYVDQKKYKQRHPEKVKEWRRRQKEREKGTIYEPKLRLAIEYKPALEQLSHDTGMSITELCLSALEEKYGIVLRKRIDKPEDK